MLIAFTVRNYKSLKNELTLNFNVENLNDIHQDNLIYLDSGKTSAVVRSIGIWGPNASGKSNVLDALKSLQNLVTSSHSYELDQKIAEYKPFKLSSETASAPIYFELEFVGIDALHYIYKVEFNREKILAESLYFYPSAKPAKLFDRIFDLPQSEWFGNYLRGVKIISCRDNQLYLSVAAQHDKSSELLKNVYRFIRSSINFLSSDFGILTDRMLRDNDFLEAVSKLLACADTGISKVDFSEYEQKVKYWNKEKEETVTRTKPIFKHQGSNIDFEFEEESAGTRCLYNISPSILYGINLPEVFVIDEIDESLHPRIAEFIIRLFHDPAVNKSNPQLIFTTHNTALMNEDHFRRDQIYFTQKDADGASELYSLDEFSQVRSDTCFEKWYREGRFEAIPEINYFELLEVIQGMFGKSKELQSI